MVKYIYIFPLYHIYIYMIDIMHIYDRVQIKPNNKLGEERIRMERMKKDSVLVSFIIFCSRGDCLKTKNSTSPT